MKLAVCLVVAVAVVMVSAAPQLKVASSLLKKLEAGESKVTVILSMAQAKSTREVLSTKNFARSAFPNRAARVNAVAALLKAETRAVQKDVLAFLQREKSEQTLVEPLWVTNKIILRNVDLSLVQKLSARSDISLIEEDRFIPLHPIEEARSVTPLANQWGVDMIQAEDVWATGNTGQGVVVANIDTGVRGGHEALVSNHRPTHGWFDPAAKSAAPNDAAGHGTHTMGTIAGQTNGIGVAPGATWIACKGCGTSNCAESDLLTCGEWVVCPTNHLGEDEDCSKAAHLVSNSWGGGQGDSFYADPIAAWRAAGIIPLFSIGNSGPYCGTANSPGDSPDVIGVGSTTTVDGVSSFSSLGPTVDGRRKPDIAAPGTNIVSASNLANNRYATMSGTSMSCPHAAGLTALLLAQHNGELDYDEVKALLEAGAVPHKPTANQPCGGISNSVWPNNHVGHGRVNAINTVLGPNSTRIH